MSERWTETLREGDAVVVAGMGLGGREREMAAVSRVTRTQVVVKSWRFRRRDGRQVGGNSWRAIWIEEATPERVAATQAEERHRALTTRIARVDWSKQPLDVLEAVAAALEPVP